MNEYTLDGHHYSFDYQELKAEYLRFVKMGDKAFLGELPAAAHLACVISFVKNLGVMETLSDVGVVHELVHLIHVPEACGHDLKRIRAAFKRSLELA